jgi:putative endonuclease
MSPTWYLYVLECADGTLYTGVTTDLARRTAEHNAGPKGARYTRARRPVVLLQSWNLPDRSAATRAEAAFKRLRRPEKLAIVAGTRSLPTGSPL